jgi:tetratricopeptide (TPR) repeat protein
MPTPLEHLQALNASENWQQILNEAPGILLQYSDDVAIKAAIADAHFSAMTEAQEKNDRDIAVKHYQDYQALALPETEMARHEKFKLLYRRLFPEYQRMQEANKLSKSGKHLEALAIYENVLTTLPDLTVAFVNVGWCIYRLLADMAPKETPDIPLVQKCLGIYSNFEIHGPSNLHSQMLRIVLYFKDVKAVPVLDFIHGWNFDNFRDEDLDPFKAGENNIIPSLRERAFLTYAKIIIEGLRQPGTPEHEKAMAYCKEFLPELEGCLPELPRNMWLPYSRAVLLKEMGHFSRANIELVTFIRQRPNEFWAWAAMAEIQRGVDDPLALACYSKALLLPTQGELATFVRESLSSLLVKYQLFNEAKTEIEQIVQARSKKEWKISDQITFWRAATWYETATAQFANKTFYIRNIAKADAILWADIPDSIGIVTHIDRVKGVFYFAVDKATAGKHNYKGPAAKLKVGDIIAVKLKEMETAGNKWYKVLSLRRELDRIPEEITQFVEEYVMIPRGRDFGFLKPSNVYVGPEVIRDNKIVDGQLVSGIALLSYNKQRNDWGWKLLCLDQPA